ncbi:MAG: putative membrane protein [uncultured Blastococcus sp.]|uniref:Putative membrane protein n=1 Tax=uncultured Blastococcus sp. TaxID=217144 RepID=A0A6J4JBR0_9ACTN|nr:MAG: putative membrane protein [uncultured Blastococcus sp.]
MVVGRKPGRARRFVQRYGWRAYAVPLLTIATLVTLVDLAISAPNSPTSGAGAPAVAQAPVTEAPVTAAEPLPTAAAEGDAEPSQAPPPPGEETYVETGAGSLSLVDGTSPVYGSGPLRRFIVEVEDGIAVDGALFAQAVETTLGDPRSWGGGGRMSFQRVGAADAAAGLFDFRVSLVSPGTMETYCPGVGTGGYTSCRYGDRAVVNLARWVTAVPHYDGDIETYRHYVVNHEVGHALGNGHVDCPGPGQLAPVMLQQTLRLDGCVKNAWPFP